MSEDWRRVPDHVVYGRVRHNVADLLSERPDAARLPVPACPGWTVLDLVEHLVHICGSATARLTAGEPPKPPARSLARIPDEVSERTFAGEGPRAELARLLDVWRSCGERLDRLVEAEQRTRILIMDAFVHELDLRHALDSPRQPGHPAYPSVLDVAVSGFFSRVRSLGLPPLNITVPGARWSDTASWSGGASPSGAGDLTVAHRHDLLRSLTGRRTHAQIAALSRSGELTPWLPAFTWGPFTPPTSPIEAEEVEGESVTPDPERTCPRPPPSSRLRKTPRQNP